MNRITQRPPVQPVACECRWLYAPVLPCSQHPAGLPGLAWIESRTQRGPVADAYLVTAHVDESGFVQGWRFTKSDGTRHDIDDVHDTCDCPDSQFRHRPCKHVAALRSLPAPAALPFPYRSAAEAAEHSNPFICLDQNGEPDFAA